ncbi:MAG: hypothetical protein OXD43_01025 [Bacteroidetes bacterium]|nr:hypothetical protein [Bacteroidota bacterium]
MTKTATLIAATLLIVAGVAMGQSVEDLQAKTEQGDAQTQHELGNSYYHGRGVPENYRLAAQWWKKAADQGHVHAEYELGIANLDYASDPLGMYIGMRNAYIWLILTKAGGIETERKELA